MFIVHTNPCATFDWLTWTTTICFNCYYSLHFFLVYNTNCSIDLYNRDLQPTIHTQLVFTQNWLNSFWIDVASSALPFISHDNESNEWCTWKRMPLPSRNHYKCKQVAWNLVIACFVYPLYSILLFIAACLLLNPLIMLMIVYFLITFFILMLLLHLCAFIMIM